MRSLIMVVISFFGFSAFAISPDAVVNQRTVALRQALGAAKTPQERLQAFGEYQDFLFEYLQSPAVDPRSPSFAELNEFESNILDISSKHLSAKACAAARRKVVDDEASPSESAEAARAESRLAPATRDTLEVLGWLCAGVR